MVNSTEASCTSVVPLKLCMTLLEILHYPCSAVGPARKLMNGCSALRILLACIMCLTPAAYMHVSVYPKAFGNQQQAGDWP